MTAKTIKRIALVIGILLCLGIGYFVWATIALNNLLNELGPCVFSSGPCSTISIDIELDTLEVDTFIAIPNGQLALANTQHEAVLILARLDASNTPVWAQKLQGATKCLDPIPLLEISNIYLTSSETGHYVHFFNDSYMEPGTIYLDKNYNFEMLCLSPM